MAPWKGPKRPPGRRGIQKKTSAKHSLALKPPEDKMDIERAQQEFADPLNPKPTEIADFFRSRANDLPPRPKGDTPTTMWATWQSFAQQPFFAVKDGEKVDLWDLEGIEATGESCLWGEVYSGFDYRRFPNGTTFGRQSSTGTWWIFRKISRRKAEMWVGHLYSDGPAAVRNAPTWAKEAIAVVDPEKAAAVQAQIEYLAAQATDTDAEGITRITR